MKTRERLAKIQSERYKKVRKELSCEYYCNGGECAKGLPRTPCDLNGCVAWWLADWAKEAGIKEGQRMRKRVQHKARKLLEKVRSQNGLRIQNWWVEKRKRAGIKEE